MDAPPVVRTKTATHSLSSGKTVHLRLHQFPGGTMLLWIGDEDGVRRGRGVLDNLSLAIAQTATPIIDNGDASCQTLARKLSVRYNSGKPVYVSMQMEAEANESLVAVMAHVNEFVAKECEHRLAIDTPLIS